MREQEWLVSEDPQAMLRCATRTESLEEWNPIEGFIVSERKLRLFACACVRQVWHLLTDDVPCGRCGGVGRLADKVEWGMPCPDCGGTGRINRSRRAVEVAERYADGLATDEEVTNAQNAVDQVFRDLGNFSKTWSVERRAWWLARSTLLGADRVAAEAIRPDLGGSPAAQAALLREIVANPFQPAALLWTDGKVDYYTGSAQHGFHSFTPYYEPCPWLTLTVFDLARSAYEERREDGTLDPGTLAVLSDELEEAGCDNKDMLKHLRGQEFVDIGVNGWAWRPLRSPHVCGCWVLDLLLGKG